MARAFSEQTITLISPHTLDECRHRLKENVESSLFAIFSDKKVTGSVSATSIEIRKRIKYRNSFQRIVSASYYQTPDGTIINGSYGLHPFVWAFLIIWYGFIALMVSALGFLAITDYLKNEHHVDASSLLLILFFLLFAIFPILLAALGRYLAKDESVFLKNFLMELLDAREVDIQPVVNPNQK